MSNIYIQEPPTSGKVLLKTSIGDLEIELWSREAPKASRNFVQLCMEGYYDGTIFHRVVKGFIAQGGDPQGDGRGGESIYGEPFKNEPHSRLRFCRRGLVALANSGNNDNGSQFFFTLGETPELQNKHTIFGKVVGDTIYNMIKFDELEIGADDRPVFPPKINRTEVIVNPYSDITPRQKKKKDKVKQSKKKAVGVKNFSLLSFGDEAEEEEVDIARVEKKSKSVHDVLDDPLMSSEPALRRVEGNKLIENVLPTEKDDSDDSLLEGDVPVKRPKLEKENPSTESLLDITKYEALKKNSSVKGKSRESFTLELLNKFKKKMDNLQNKAEESEEKEDNWLTHEFKCVDKEIRLAKDANSKSDSWFDITDPRNELNVRKREDSSKALKKL